MEQIGAVIRRWKQSDMAQARGAVEDLPRGRRSHPGRGATNLMALIAILTDMNHKTFRLSGHIPLRGDVGPDQGGAVISVRDRFAAGTASAVSAILAVGAKAAPVVLIIWVAAVLAGVRWRSDRPHNFLSQVFSMPAAVAAGLLFALCAAASATWSKNPELALKAAGLLLFVLVSLLLLIFGIKRLRQPTRVLMTGWIVIGLLAGSLVLLLEVASNYSFLMWLSKNFDGIRGPDGAMMIDRGGVRHVNPALANWSVAGLNMLLWPVLLAAAIVVPSGYGKAFQFTFFALVVAITFASDHQTSQLAIIASLLVFLASLVSWRWTFNAVLAGAAGLLLFAVPLAYLEGRTLELQKARWASESLQGRFVIWGNASARYVEAPFLGIGANNTTRDYTYGVDDKAANPSGPYHHPHNMLLQIWLELGVLGAAIALAFLLLVLRQLNSLAGEVAPFALAMFSAVLVQSISTWDLWNWWFLSAVVFATSILILGDKILQGDGEGRRVAFSEIWLPQSWVQRS